ncbi:MAG: HIT domain-containing protein [Candidatus Heimdallarchaeota archaeon]|nr:HIT domain-containing protein [Candidatus Heimdallarchaeota archaeon]
MDEEVSWHNPMFDSSILSDHKFEYVIKPKNYGEQTIKSCIICRIVDEDPDTPSFEICRTERFVIFLNLYPFTNAHLLISPQRHLMGYEELNAEELGDLAILTRRCIQVVKHNGKTDSLNVGWNQGTISGGSIKHFHLHIVPRYMNELNFMEIIARTRPFVRSLENTQKDLMRYSDYITGKKSFGDVINKLS